MSTEAYARVKSSHNPVWLAEFRHSTFPSPLRWAELGRDVTLTLEATAPVDANTQVTFLGVNLGVKPPTRSDEPDSVISLTMPGISHEANDYLTYANQTLEPIDVTMRCVLLDSVSGAIVEQGTEVIHLQVRSAKVDVESASCSLGRRNAANQAFPSVYYTPESNPSLY